MRWLALASSARARASMPLALGSDAFDGTVRLGSADADDGLHLVARMSDAAASAGDGIGLMTPGDVSHPFR